MVLRANAIPPLTIQKQCKLGYAGATKFILLYEPGEGDYTKNRKKLFEDLTIEKILKELKGTKE